MALRDKIHIILKSLSSCTMMTGILLSATPAHATISQTPLLLGGGSVPGNLALTPSVEFPTVISVANLGDYNHNSTYVGYFDSEKCYEYVTETFIHPFFGAISSNDNGGYFTPTRIARNCTGKTEWSGNYLNWASTQTIDPFRKALTGGYRVEDSTTRTILEKATRADRSSYFPNRSITNATTATQVAPYDYDVSAVESSVTSVDSNASDALKAYQRNKSLRLIVRQTSTDRRGRVTDRTTTKFYSVRVEVCKANLLEANCKQYGNIWKPEGLLQRYANNIRYSAFSYLNEDGNTRNGGVMRAPQSYIGQTKREPGNPDEQANPTPEWSASTGQLLANPYNDPIGNSGVINYINKFGELTNRHKSNDPVSELYYTALRYFKNQGNIAAYSNITDNAQRDMFPVIQDWAGKDPIQYACQKNVILGIGDVYTHEDRNIPAGGDTLDVNSWTQTVFDLEGINKTANSVFTGRGNSAYIAGLAYYANTTDIRSDISGEQRISTHWVDVRENQFLEPKANNQYWLAAKYGGFKVPANYTKGTALQNAWWKTNQDPALSTGDPRPDNFYVASDAENMVNSLELAFAQIVEELQSTLNTISSNSTRLETDTAVFQSSLNSKHWSGDLVARSVASNGTVSDTPVWSVSEKLNTATVSTRNVFTATPLAAAANTANGSISTTAVDFNWGSISTAQRAQLQTANEITANDTTTAQNRLNYLRGDRTLERTDTNQNQPFRQRGGRLGDIVNSDPQYAGSQDFGYSLISGSAWSSARSAYASFRTDKASRTPLVIFGANDGMLHGVNASLTANGSGGNEVFAFIPSSVFSNLRRLTDPNYSHRYYVDGTPRVADAWINNSWRTLVAGTTGAGGNSVFVLDITNPNSITNSSFLWEFSHPDMGYTIGQPAIVALPNGQFAVVVTSGYHDTARDSAKVWFLDAANGSVIYTVDVSTTGSLGSPLLADTDNDKIADKLYVGDTQGNLWKYNITSSGVSNPLTSNAPLFIAKDSNNTRQPITAPLSSAFNEKGQHMIVFGTGSFMRIGDNEIPESPQIQSIYGIIDGSEAIERSNLLQQSILAEVNNGTAKARAVSQNNMTTAQKGWYLDLAWTSGQSATGALGERVVAKATLRSDRAIFTSMIPSSDPCASGGTSWVMALNLFTGGRLNYAYFDTNKDGTVSEADKITIGDDQFPASGISDPTDGVIKGAAPLYRWLCYAGSAGGTPKCVKVAASQRYGRQSWQEIR